MSIHGQQVALVTADVLSAFAVIGSLSGILPLWAALAAIIWYTIQVWESNTVQTWVKGHRHARRRSRLKRKHKTPPAT